VFRLSGRKQGQRYDREKWRVQLNPILELWQQLLSASGGAVNKRPGAVAAGAQKEESKKAVPKPVDDFVEMESELSSDVCSLVDSSLSALKKVLFGSGLLTPGIQVTINIPTFN